jgi:hypothetical protein
LRTSEWIVRRGERLIEYAPRLRLGAVLIKSSSRPEVALEAASV